MKRFIIIGGIAFLLWIACIGFLFNTAVDLAVEVANTEYVEVKKTTTVIEPDGTAVKTDSTYFTTQKKK